MDSYSNKFSLFFFFFKIKENTKWKISKLTGRFKIIRFKVFLFYSCQQKKRRSYTIESLVLVRN